MRTVAFCVGVIAFAFGFAMAYESKREPNTRNEVAAGLDDEGEDPPSTSAPATTTSTSPSVPTTTSVPPSTTAVAPATTESPTTVAAPTTTIDGQPPATTTPATVASTVAPTIPTTSTTPVVAPANLVVHFPKNSLGYLSVFAGSEGGFSIQNLGGTPSDFTVTVSGYLTLGGTAVYSSSIAGFETRPLLFEALDPPAGVSAPQGVVTIFSPAGQVASIFVSIS